VTTRRAILAALLGGLIAVPPAALAQQPGKLWRIGLLSFGTSDAASETRWKALRDRLRELGYVEGQNVAFETRWAEGQLGRLGSLVSELIAAKVDILVTAGTESAVAARKATAAIPIVMATGADPVVMGLAASLAKPGGNVTGVISLIGPLTAKRIELLRQLIPRASRFALLRDPDNRGSEVSVRAAERAVKSLGITLHAFPARNSAEIGAAFPAMKRARVDAVILGENTAYTADRERIADLAIKQRLPMMVPAKEYAQAGALVSYATDYPDLYRRAAAYVDKILKGAKPGDLPIEQPTTFELVINLKTAKALGVTVPPALLQRADEVIQ